MRVTTGNNPAREQHWWSASAVAPLLPVLLLLVAWLGAKAVLFDQLEYTSDIFQNLALSRSTFQGLGLLWEPQYKGLIHNYVFVLSFYPLTAWLGAYGLFVGHALLLLAAASAVAREAAGSDGWRRNLYWLAVYVLLLGPTGFWLWDDPLYGWHTELTFLPLAVLFALGLARGSKVAWCWAAMLVSNREEGAILAWAVHVLFVMMSREPGSGESAPRQSTRELVRRLALITVVYALIFGANLGVLLARQPSMSDSRVGAAAQRFTQAWDDEAVRAETGAAVVDAATIWLAGALVFLAGLRLRGALLAAAVTVPIVAVGMFGMLAYRVGGAMQAQGLGWPPRFTMLWAPLAVALLYSARFSAAPAIQVPALRVALCVVVAAGSVWAQASALATRRGYDIVARVESVTGRGPRLAATSLTPREEDVLRCLGSRLPANTTVKCPGFVVARFQFQRFMSDPRRADVVMCDEASLLRWPVRPGCIDKGAIERATERIYVDRLFLAFVPALRPVIERCTTGPG
jgi:hypothetical protein